MCLNTTNDLQNLVGDELPAETTALVTTTVPDEVISESEKEVTAEAPYVVVTMALDTEVDSSNRPKYTVIIDEDIIKM